MEEEYLELMCVYRRNFVEEIIGLVNEEQFENDKDFVIDAVDIAVMNERTYVCACGHIENTV